MAGGWRFNSHQCKVGRGRGNAALRAGHAGTTGVGSGGAARPAADVYPDESAQLYALWAGAAGGGVRDGQPVPEREQVRGKAGGELSGAVRAVAERGNTGAARPADSLVAGRD